MNRAWRSDYSVLSSRGPGGGLHEYQAIAAVAVAIRLARFARGRHLGRAASQIRELLDAGADNDDIGLTEEEKRELLAE